MTDDPLKLARTSLSQVMNHLTEISSHLEEVKLTPPAPSFWVLYDANRGMYLNARTGWTRDNDQATRFSRESDAEDYSAATHQSHTVEKECGLCNGKVIVRM